MPMDAASGIAAPGAKPIAMSWAGSPWSLTGLSFLNALLAVLTLGVYSFWGRTEVRKRIWSSIRFDNEPLAYTGTGKELFIGFLIAFLVVLLPTLLISLAVVLLLPASPLAQAAVQIGFTVLFFYLAGVAVYRARRYRLSRTNWRGIRGALEGSSWSYGWTNFWTMLLVPGTALAIAIGAYFGLGRPNLATPAAMQGFALQYGLWFGLLYVAGLILWLLLVPWRTTKLQRHITNDMTFGSRPFSFQGSSRPLYVRFIARWIGVLVLAIATPVASYFAIGPKIAAGRGTGAPGTPVPLSTGETLTVLAILLTAFILYSVLTAWYKAAEANYFAKSTRYEGQPFKLGISAGGLIWLVVTNTLLVIFSLTILRPVAQARTAQYFVQNFSLDGPIDAAAIAQSQAAMSKTGEGLAQAFDVDAF